MKKVVGIVLALVLVFSFGATAFAAESVDAVEVFIEDPNDPEVVIPAEDAGQELYVDPLTDADKEIVDQMIVEEQQLQPDLIAPFDEIKEIGFVEVGVTTTDAAGDPVWEPYPNGGWVTFWDDSIRAGIDTLEVLRMFFDEEGFWDTFEVYNAQFYDPSDNSWSIWVEDVGAFSLYMALIKRGVAPAEAAEIVQQQTEQIKSPKTADNGVADSLLWTVMLMGIAFAAFSVRRAVKAAK